MLAGEHGGEAGHEVTKVATVAPFDAGHLCLDEGWRVIDVAGGREFDIIQGILAVKSVMLYKSCHAPLKCLSCAVKATELRVDMHSPQQVGPEVV